jgi:DNA repair photolyase
LEELTVREIRGMIAQSSRFRDSKKAREAAFKAWRTIREKKRSREVKNTLLLSEFTKGPSLPPGVNLAHYRISAPLVKPSKLTYKSRGGVGKELSDGWAVNFIIGCTMACRFCYVDEIHKKWGNARVGDIVYEDWGNYVGIPYNLDEVIEETEWSKWKGQEVMLSSTHEPYLPFTFKWTRKILEKALPEGVRFCIQTRSPLVERDFSLLREYRNQIRLQVSVATYNTEFSRVIEPRVVPPMRRMETLEKAKNEGLDTGIIIAPVFPPTRLRMDVEEDLGEIAYELARIRPNHIYGESLHIRGLNQVYVQRALGEQLNLEGFDEVSEHIFCKVLSKYGLKGIWWAER